MIRDDARVSVATKDSSANDQATYQFDRIFTQDATQEEVFHVVMKDSVDSVLNGNLHLHPPSCFDIVVVSRV